MSGFLLRPKALAELEAIGDFIARDNPRRATSFVDEILEFCARVSERPRAYARRDDLAAGVRQAVYGRYLVFYRITDGKIVITRILHSARRLEDLI